MNICIFASGAGSNFRAILKAIKKKDLKSNISLLISNNPDSGAVKIAAQNNIEYKIINKKLYPGLDEEKYSMVFLKALIDSGTDMIVLCGYMKLVESEVLKEYKGRIVNIHPSLLPLFGGKGMYGINVHKAVIASGVKVSGITVHFVNENYDEGKIIFQKCCEVKSDDDEFTLQKRILKMEHRYYPKVIQSIENLEFGMELKRF